MMEQKIFGPRAGKVTCMISLHRQDAFPPGVTTEKEITTTFTSLQKGIFLYDSSRIRKIIRLHRTDLSTLTFSIPHTEEYILPRDDFENCLKNYFKEDYQKITWSEMAKDYVVLLAIPQKKDLAVYSVEHFAFQYWSYLFHAEIHKQFDRLQKQSRWSPFQLQESILKLGSLAFEEIRDVLRRDGFLFNPNDDQEVLMEFASYYLQLLHFFPRKLPLYFPSLKDQEDLVKKIFKQVGIDEEEALKTSRPPYTSEIKELRERADRLRLQEALANVFDFNYHIKSIIHHPLLLDHFGEEARVQDFERDRQAFIKLLVGQIIQDGKIMGELDFLTVRNLAIREGVELERDELFLLDRILKEQFSTLYSPSTRWQRTLLLVRARNAIARDRESAKRLQITEETIQKFEGILTNLTENPPNFKQRAWKSLRSNFTFYLAFGWFFFLFGRSFSLISNLALRIQDAFLLYQFDKFYGKATWAQERKNPVWAMMNLCKSQSVFERVYQRYKTPASEKFYRSLQREFQKYIKPVSEYFTEELQLDEKVLAGLQDMLEYLIHKTSLGGEGIESELLMDIENSRIDGNLEFSELNLWGWIRSFGGEPLRIPLPYQNQMRRLLYLGSALHKSHYLKLPKEKLNQYQQILQKACHMEEERIRDNLKPFIREAFEHQNLPLKNSQKKIAFLKIQEEMLDTIIERGHSHFTDLRDVLSRNHLKLEDLKVWEVFQGDSLLRIDKELSKKLRGIHRSAEIYMRFLQVLSSLFFGTRRGRRISWCFFIPVGGAVVLLVLSKSILHHLFHINPFDPLTLFITVVALEFFIHSKIFRKIVFSPFTLRPIFKKLLVYPALGGGTLFLICCAYFWKTLIAYKPQGMENLYFYLLGYGASFIIALVLMVLKAKKIPSFLRNLLVSPALGGGVLFILCHIYFWNKLIADIKPQTMKEVHFALLVYSAFFIMSFAFVNTRIGIKLSSGVGEAYGWAVHAIGKGLFLRVLFFIIQCSRSFLKKMEHLVYVVSDYLRFIQGEKVSTSYTKALMVLLWTPFAYILSLYILLFIEPQINPLKFPVVSIFYKVLLVKPELYTKLIHGLEQGSGWLLPNTIAYGFAWFTAFVFTGLFGFLAWELQENWRLYEHNASKVVKPVAVGSHGETITQFLRPGFHSGTLPHLFQKLRKATAQAEVSKMDYSPVLPLEQEMRHIEESIKRFADRDFLLTLRVHPLFEHFSGEVEKVEITSSAISVFMTLKKDRETWAFQTSFEEKKGYLVANFALKEGNLENLSSDQQKVMAYLLGAFYKKAGVDLTEEEIEVFLRQMYSEYFDQKEQHLHYQVEPHAIRVTFRDSGTPGADSSMSRMRRGLRRMSTLWKSSNYRDLSLDKILFHRHNLEWASFNSIYDEAHVSLGDQFLFLIDREGKLSAEDLDNFKEVARAQEEQGDEEKKREEIQEPLQKEGSQEPPRAEEKASDPLEEK